MLKCGKIDPENIPSALQNYSSTDTVDSSTNALAKSEIKVISLNK